MKYQEKGNKNSKRYSRQQVMYIRHSNGKGQKLMIPEEDTVKNMVQRILQQLKRKGQQEVQDKQWNLFHKGHLILPSSQLVKDSQFQNNSIVHVVQKNKGITDDQDIKIKVKVKENEFQSVYNLKTNINQIKNDVIDEYDLKPELLYICHLGTQLKGSKSLEQCGIVEDTWLSAEYFEELLTINVFDMDKVRMAESIDIGSSIESFNPFMKKFQFDQSSNKSSKLFSSAISETIQYQVKQIPYRFSNGKQPWVGNCYIFMQNKAGTNQFTVDCKNTFTIDKLRGMIAKLQRVDKKQVLLYNPVEKTKCQSSDEQSNTVAELDWTGRITAQILVMQILYQVKLEKQ